MVAFSTLFRFTSLDNLKRLILGDLSVTKAKRYLAIEIAEGVKKLNTFKVLR
jgi:hypothetical protein